MTLRTLDKIVDIVLAHKAKPKPKAANKRKKFVNLFDKIWRRRDNVNKHAYYPQHDAAMYAISTFSVRSFPALYLLLRPILHC
jgi:hypothetical protein